MLPIEDFVQQTPAIVGLIRRLAEIESPSTDKAAVDRVGAVVAEELRRLGAAVAVDKQMTAGNNVVGRWGAGSGGILLLCHMDTVWEVGTLARRPVRVEDGRLYGPGVYDMKAGIALALTALRMLRERGGWPARPVTVLCTSDEETGSHGSRALIEQLARDATLVLVLEPATATGALKTARKGTGEIELVARGRSAHAGVDHALGRNAIEELAHHILAAQRLTDYAAGTTVSVGRVSGGTRTNVVPDAARAEADVRVAVPAEAERLARWAESLQPVLEGASVKATLTINRPPMVRDATMMATFGRAQEIGARLGLDLTEGSTGGASDANFVAALGVPVLDGLGPLGDGAHAEHEHLVIASLAERTALLAALLGEWP
ncbi:MAG: M20 family metallopeptidase [Chloroflexi bacterium]|nr:M20 family metallopeptidase [Chloroflexota bacterium]